MKGDMACATCRGTGRVRDPRWYRELRKERGWTLQYVSSLLGVSTMYISEIERGVKPLSERMQLTLDRLYRLRS